MFLFFRIKKLSQVWWCILILQYLEGLESVIQGHLQLYFEPEGSLGYMKPYL